MIYVILVELRGKLTSESWEMGFFVKTNPSQIYKKTSFLPSKLSTINTPFSFLSFTHLFIGFKVLDWLGSNIGSFFWVGCLFGYKMFITIWSSLKSLLCFRLLFEIIVFYPPTRTDWVIWTWLLWKAISNFKFDW